MQRPVLAALLALAFLPALAHGQAAVIGASAGGASAPCTAFGTGASTCAQGNDSRIVNAVQPSTSPTLSGLTVTGASDLQGNAKLGTGSTSNTVTIDNNVVLGVGGANILEMRNGLNAQTLRVFQSYTDSLNNERITLTGGSLPTISPEASGTGTFRSLTINGASITFDSVSTPRWIINNSGHFVANTDNTYDIGASGATRPRSGYFAANLTAGGSLAMGSSSVLGLASEHGFATRTTTALSAGQTVVGINANTASGATTTYAIAGAYGNGSSTIAWGITADGTRFKLGGTSSSFPMVKGNGAAINFRLADDSGDAAATMGAITASGHLTFTGAAPSVASCGTSPAVGTGSNDTRGRITTGSGTTSCAVSFNAAYPATPFCTVTLEGSGGFAVWLSAVNTGGFTVNFNSAYQAPFVYQCDG